MDTHIPRNPHLSCQVYIPIQVSNQPKRSLETLSFPLVYSISACFGPQTSTVYFVTAADKFRVEPTSARDIFTSRLLLNKPTAFNLQRSIQKHFYFEKFVHFFSSFWRALPTAGKIPALLRNLLFYHIIAAHVKHRRAHCVMPTTAKAQCSVTRSCSTVMSWIHLERRAANNSR